MKTFASTCLCFVILLSGCATSSKSLLSDTYIETLKTKYSDYQSIINEYDAAADKRLQRDIIINNLLSIADDNYRKFRDDLQSSRVTWYSVFDIITLGLTGTASVTGAKLTKSYLSALATFSTGTKSALDKNIFAEKSVATILNAIETGRSKISTQIFSGLQKDVSAFTLEEGLRLVKEYNDTASVIYAITQLSIDSGAKADKAQQEAAKAKREYYRRR